MLLDSAGPIDFSYGDMMVQAMPAAFGAEERRSLLLVGTPDHHAELSAMAAGAELRVMAMVSLEDMAERLRPVIGADVLVVDLRGVPGADPQLVVLLSALLAWPGYADARPLILVDMANAEAVAAMLHVAFDRMLCDPSPSDIALSLCLLAQPAQARLHDIGRDSDAARLDRLSAEVRRLAQTIDRLARDDNVAARPLNGRHDEMTPPTGEEWTRQSGNSAAGREEVRALLQARRMRERFLPGDLFADPAWDMMLDLMAARIDGKRVSVSSLCIAAAVPPTTALRWIAQLTERGIFVRRNDPNDARRVFISLSDEAAESLTDWFAAARRAGLRFTG
ncbi:MAG: MarR family transcriptional regulator [Sphingobium sp.]